jgi:hypothetical protein
MAIAVDLELFGEIRRRHMLGIDAMGVLEVVAERKARHDVRPALEAIVDDSCELDLPMNVRLPLRAILHHFGLLEGILRHLQGPPKIQSHI